MTILVAINMIFIIVLAIIDYNNNHDDGNYDNENSYNNNNDYSDDKVKIF